MTTTNNYIGGHHEKTLESYNTAINIWENAVNDQSRCQFCWLRSINCFCEQLKERQRFYSENSLSLNAIQLTIYYHFKEIGRSANTAHILPLLIPNECNTFLFGDLNSEKKFYDNLIDEIITGRQNTCFLYPTPDAPYISDWIQSRPNCDDPINLIILDGTYSQAIRQVKHIQKVLFPHQVPVVKLNLGLTGCSSAVAGIMHQPSAQKICSFQAAVMALEQTNQNPQLCESLYKDLDLWLSYILKCKVKFGKHKIRGTPGFMQKPSDLVSEHLLDHPPPVNHYNNSKNNGTKSKSASTNNNNINVNVNIKKNHKKVEYIYTSGPKQTFLLPMNNTLPIVRDNNNNSNNSNCHVSSEYSGDSNGIVGVADDCDGDNGNGNGGSDTGGSDTGGSNTGGSDTGDNCIANIHSHYWINIQEIVYTISLPNIHNTSSCSILLLPKMYYYNKNTEKSISYSSISSGYFHHSDTERTATSSSNNNFADVTYRDNSHSSISASSSSSSSLMNTGNTKAVYMLLLKKTKRFSIFTTISCV